MTRLQIVTALLVLNAINGCTSIIKHHAAAPTAPAQSCVGSTGTPGCESMLISNRAPFVAKVGDKVTLSGEHFRDTLTLAAASPTSKIVKGDLSVLSDTRAQLIVSAGTSLGLTTFTLTQDGVSQNISLLIATAQTDHPVFTAEASLICSDQQYYDINGALQTGTKTCSSTNTPPPCAADGGVNCVASSTFPAAAVNTAYLNAANIKSGVTIGGVTGTYSAAGLAACTSDGQSNCMLPTYNGTTNLYKAALTTNLGPWDVRVGKTLGGVAGALKTNCRNGVDSTIYNADLANVSSLTNNTVTNGTLFDFWDTSDDSNGFSMLSPVTAWSATTYCDASTWTDVSPGGTCATVTAGSCQYQDKISNLRVTADQGNVATDWATALQYCDALSFTGQSGIKWRLPTEKELLSLYEHGIASLASASFVALSDMQGQFWSASNALDTAGDPNAWVTALSTGQTAIGYKQSGQTYHLVCVSP